MGYDNTLSGNKILVIDDENEIGWIFSKILGDAGYKVISSTSGKD
ncbi:MAG: response regulator, partial [Candidatus Firestonebacteria bacterium]|nr:response regulator [Candidatus Firestonebacteria bacterium]